jgi:predicted anti-sigma-YlaC factor YlaD
MSVRIGTVVDADATPSDALRLAEHLSECTACRIVLARERRLAEALNGIEDATVDDEAFRSRVMDALGNRACPRRKASPRSALRRGLRLAGWLAAFPALESALRVVSRIDWEGFGVGLGHPSLDRAAGLLVGWAGTAASALAAAAPGVPFSPVLPGFAGVTAGAMLVAAALCALGSAAAVVGATRVPLRRS